MIRKALLILFISIFTSLLSSAQTIVLDSGEKEVEFWALDDDPTKYTKWAFGLGLGYYFHSGNGGPLVFTTGGFYQFNPDYNFDFKVSLPLQVDERESPEEIEAVKFREIQIVGHKRLLSKVSTKSTKLTYSRDDFSAQLFRRKTIFTPLKVQRSLLFDFGMHYLRIAEFEHINLGNLPTTENVIPKMAGNAGYTSLVAGLSYLSKWYLKYSVDGKEGIRSGFTRFYLNYSYVIHHSLEVYGNPINPPIPEDQENEFVAINKAGWKLGFEAHDYILSGPISTYYGAEFAWKPHFHDPNSTLDHPRGTGPMIMLTLGVRIAQLP